jgi:NAD(P)-dependent dehydrogenase (short-subunit alcohol dehydrogenase family)
MNLVGKVAIVTGSSRGIGKAIAIDCAKAGAKVVVAARTESAGKLPGTIHETAQGIEKLGGQALAIRCDVTDEQDVEATAKMTLEKFGRIDILINDAAVGYYVPFTEIPSRHWDLVMRVNLKGPFLCTKAVLPTMMEQRSGSLVNISSSAAEHVYSMIPGPGGEKRTSGCAYGASKAALERLTLGLAPEIRGHNIAVNALKPAAPTHSEGLAFWNPDVDVSLFHSAHEFMSPATVFLASQDASGITGGIFYDKELCEKYGLVPL